MHPTTTITFEDGCNLYSDVCRKRNLRHPNCRCCIIPVIENVENSKKIVYNNKKAIDKSTVSSPVDITNSTTKTSETKIAPEWENANFAPDKVENIKNTFQNMVRLLLMIMLRAQEYFFLNQLEVA